MEPPGPMYTCLQTWVWTRLVYTHVYTHGHTTEGTGDGVDVVHEHGHTTEGPGDGEM